MSRASSLVAQGKESKSIIETEEYMLIMNEWIMVLERKES